MIKHITVIAKDLETGEEKKVVALIDLEEAKNWVYSIGDAEEIT